MVPSITSASFWLSSTFLAYREGGREGGGGGGGGGRKRERERENLILCEYKRVN